MIHGNCSGHVLFKTHKYSYGTFTILIIHQNHCPEQLTHELVMQVWSQGNSSSLTVIGIVLTTFLLIFVRGPCAFEYEQFQIGQTTNVRRLRLDIHLLSIRCQFEDNK